MATTYPGTLDSFVNPVGTNTLDSPDHATQHTNTNGAAVALETKIGVGSGSPVLNQIMVGSGNGTSGWTGTWNNATLGTATINASTIGTPAITGGTANAITLGTPTIGTITIPGTVTPLTPSAALSPASGTIADSAGGTLTVNAQAGQVFYSAFGTAAGNRTIGTPQNATAWQAITYALKASGSANGTLVWAPIFRMSSNTGTPTIGTASTWNYYGWRYNSIDSKWDYQGQSPNVI